MPDPINVNPSPKARFMAYKPFVDAHRELIAKAELQRAFDYSLMELQHELTKTQVDGNTAASNLYRLMGANDLIRTLKQLAESQTLPKRAPLARELDHTV